MILVKCNNCNKETRNNTGKCIWCNKELDTNLESIGSKFKNVEKKNKQHNEEKTNKQHNEEKNIIWICEGCKEENELNFDRCWKCEAIDKNNKVKRKEYLSRTHIVKKIKDEVSTLALQVIDELRSKHTIGRRIIYMIGLFVWWAVGALLIAKISGEKYVGFGFIGALIIVYPYHFLHKRFIKIPQERKRINKAIKKLGLENHKYINEINDIITNSSLSHESF